MAGIQGGDAPGRLYLDDVITYIASGNVIFDWRRRESRGRAATVGSARGMRALLGAEPVTRLPHEHRTADAGRCPRRSGTLSHDRAIKS